jgi:hypothetical protein
MDERLHCPHLVVRAGSYFRRAASLRPWPLAFFFSPRRAFVVHDRQYVF